MPVPMSYRPHEKLESQRSGNDPSIKQRWMDAPGAGLFRWFWEQDIWPQGTQSEHRHHQTHPHHHPRISGLYTEHREEADNLGQRAGWGFPGLDPVSEEVRLDHALKEGHVQTGSFPSLLQRFPIRDGLAPLGDTSRCLEACFVVTTCGGSGAPGL